MFSLYVDLSMFIIHLLQVFSVTKFNLLSLLLLNFVSVTRCAIPYLENDTFSIQRIGHQDLVDQYIPNTDPDDSTLKYDRCQYYAYDTPVANGNASRRLVKCSKWVYSEEIYKSTFAKEVFIINQSWLTLQSANGSPF